MAGYARPDFSRAASLIGPQLLINTLTLMSPLFTPLGLLLSLPVSRCNHSCQPNAIPMLSRRTLTLRTMEPVTAGTELTLSYTDITVSPAERCAALQSRYHFHCACPACSASLTLGLPDPPPVLSKLAPSTLDSVVSQANELLLTAAQNPDPRGRLVPLSRPLAIFPPEYPAYRPPLSRVRTDLSMWISVLNPAEQHAFGYLHAFHSAPFGSYL